jgi:peptidyl-prolyl cis-trans isomerase C
MNYRHILLLVGLVSLASCQSKTDGSSAGPSVGSADHSPAVATVNGTNITKDFFEQYIKAITGGKSSSAELNPEQRTQALDNLIRGQVVGQEAMKQGIDKAPDTAALLELTRLNVLQNAVAEGYLKDKKATDQEIRAEYENEVANLGKQEYHAKHILVATEPFAQRVVERLKHGEKFEDVAKHESMDPSKDNGGDLGWFTPDKMVKPFADAVLALKPGEYTQKPVQTQYGWHVIELVEMRDLQPPPYDNVKQRLEQVVQTKKLKAYEEGLVKNAKVEKKLDTGATAAPAPDADKAAPKPDDKKTGG